MSDNQSTCLQNLLLTHLVHVIKVSRIIKSYYVMHLVLETARRLLHSAVHLYGYARFCIKEQTKDSLIYYKILRNLLAKGEQDNLQAFKSMSNSVTAINRMKG